MKCTSNSSRIVPRKDAFHAKCSGKRFTRVRSGGILISPFASQRSPVPSSYSLDATQNKQLVEEGDHPVAINRQEGETIKALRAELRENP